LFFFFFFSFSWLCSSHVVILCCYFCINITTFSQKCENTTTWTTWLTTNPSHIGVATFMRWCYCLPTLMAMLLSHVGVGGAFLHWCCCLPTLALLFVYIGGVVALSHWSCCSSHVLLLLFSHLWCCFFRVGVIVIFTLMLNAQVLIGPTFVVVLLTLVLLLFPWLVWYFYPLLPCVTQNLEHQTINQPWSEFCFFFVYFAHVWFSNFQKSNFFLIGFSYTLIFIYISLQNSITFCFVNV